MLSDEELVLLIADDNEQAFKVLYEKYWAKMLMKAYVLLKSHDMAEEVVQDAAAGQEAYENHKESLESTENGGTTL